MVMSMVEMKLDKLLQSVVVLDLTAMWSGPSATLVLALLGARVIKIETARRPDGMRQAGGEDATSPVFQVLNRDKESLVLELDQAEDYEKFMQLVSKADLVVENFSPRVRKNLKIDFPYLKQINPRILLVSMPAVGGDGHLSQFVSYGSGIEAMAGATWLTRYWPHGAPMGAGVPVSDPLSGMTGALLMLAALLQRERDAQGRHWELSQLEVMRDALSGWPELLENPLDSNLVPEVLSVAEVLKRGLVDFLETPPHLVPPWDLGDGTKWEIKRSAPSLGMDQDKVFKDWGGGS